MDEVNIQKQIGDLATKVAESKSEILDSVSIMLEKALRKTEENIAQGYQLKTSEAISIALKAFKEDTDGKYAAKWVENFVKNIIKGFLWLVGIIVVSIIGWVSGFLHFFVELFYKMK